MSLLPKMPLLLAWILLSNSIELLQFTQDSDIVDPIHDKI
jgi:hypothetical protein